jgi:hypothetical protein
LKTFQPYRKHSNPLESISTLYKVIPALHKGIPTT